MRRYTCIALFAIGCGFSHGVASQGGEPELPFPLASTGFMCAEPIYPVAALRSGAEGVSRLAYTVTESGEIADAVVQVSSGETREHKLLDRSALAFLRTCRYKGNAAPTPGRFSFEYRWSIS